MVRIKIKTNHSKRFALKKKVVVNRKELTDDNSFFDNTMERIEVGNNE